MIAILRANWHTDIVNQGIKGFEEEIQRLGHDPEAIEIWDVPGSLEFPLQSQLLAKTGKYQAIVCIGLIVDGGIYRHEFVAQTVVDGIVDVSRETEVPVISVAISPQKFDENDPKDIEFFRNHFIIKGTEAAQATDMMIKNLQKINK